MTFTKIAIALFASVTLSACASWMPDDPYLAAKETKALEIPEGMDNPPTDATLTTQIGGGQLVEGGHKPPAVEMPSEVKPEADTDSSVPKE